MKLKDIKVKDSNELEQFVGSLLYRLGTPKKCPITGIEWLLQDVGNGYSLVKDGDVIKTFDKDSTVVDVYNEVKEAVQEAADE